MHVMMFLQCFSELQPHISLCNKRNIFLWQSHIVSVAQMYCVCEPWSHSLFVATTHNASAGRWAYGTASKSNPSGSHPLLLIPTPHSKLLTLLAGAKVLWDCTPHKRRLRQTRSTSATPILGALRRRDTHGGQTSAPGPSALAPEPQNPTGVNCTGFAPPSAAAQDRKSRAPGPRRAQGPF